MLAIAKKFVLLASHVEIGYFFDRTTFTGKPMELSIRKKITLLLCALVGGTLFTGFELLAEEETVSTLEFIMDSIEKSLIFVGAGGVFVLLRDLRKQQQERVGLIRELEIARVQGSDWRKRAQTFMNGVGEEIDRQFDEWGLSDAECEVGRLMIKGLSHKEIADLRGTAEATVRQQARNVYQKSGLPGKAAFSAYFLEDLLTPAVPTQH